MIINAVGPVLGTQNSRAFVAMGQLKAVGIFAMAIMCAIVGRKRQMVNQIEDMKNKIDELSEMVKKKSDENESLKAEKKALKQRIKDLEDICDGSCVSDYEDLPFWYDERDKLIAKLQDQHQQDCIRINDLTTTVHVLAGLYSTLRKNVGRD